MTESERGTTEEENTNDANWSTEKVAEAYSVGYVHSRLRNAAEFDTAEFVTEVLEQLEEISDSENRDVAIDKCVGLAHDRGVNDYENDRDYGTNLA